MLTREEKANVVEGLTERLKRHKIAIFTDIRGLSVAKLSALRRDLRAAGAELKVAKKTLLARALAAAGIGIEPRGELEGEVAVIFGYEDQAAPAKAALKFSRENETFRVLKGFLAGRILAAAEVLALARLPTRGELLGQLVRTLQAPIQNLANVLQGNIRNLVVVLNNIKDKKE